MNNFLDKKIDANQYITQLFKLEDETQKLAEELFCFPYPFQLPNSFLRSVSKNDLRLKFELAVSKQEKRLDLKEFFNIINVRNDQLIQIKKNLIQLFKELVEIKLFTMR